jgi:hypothetical protein
MFCRKPPPQAGAIFGLRNTGKGLSATMAPGADPFQASSGFDGPAPRFREA